MGIFDSMAPAKPTADQGAQRVKRLLAQSVRQAETALNQVRQIIDRHGADNIQSALGENRAEVTHLYHVLKSLVEQNKPGAKVADMPLSGGSKQEQ